MIRAGAWALVLGTIVACGPTTRPAVAKPPAAPDFTPVESRVLAALGGADPRIALRVGSGNGGAEREESAFRELLTSTETTHSVGTVLDPFAFTAREAALKKAESELGAWSTRAAKTTYDTPAAEDELLVRFVAEERLRLSREADLPRGASMLVRGLMKTYRVSATKPSPETMDGWLHDRLEKIRASLERPLSSAERQELDDALDPLEHLLAVNPAGKAMAALARLRVDLTSAGPPPVPAADADVRRTLSVFFGERRSTRELREAFVAALESLDPSGDGTTTMAEPTVASMLVTDDDREPSKAFGSTMRGTVPPPERTPASDLLRRLGDGDVAVSRVLVADALVYGIWAVDLATATLPVVGPRMPRPRSRLRPDVEERLTRHVQSEPAAAWGLALVAERFARTPPTTWGDDAQRIAARGNVPWDVALRETRTDGSRPGR
ncbi:MAG: hypothetical protein U0169_21130 [Polyangiaceae bacterium]